MENVPVKSEKKSVVQSECGIFLDTARFEHAWRVAQMLAQSTMVPDQFRNNPGNCMIALNFADRTGLDPFMVAQKMYVIKGRPGIEGQLAIALINRTGRFEPLRFEFSGEGKTRACTAYAKDVDSGERCESTVTWDMVEAEGWNKKGGSKWNTLPDMMFQYRSATFFGRLYCPEALLGMMTTDELRDIHADRRASAPEKQEGAEKDPNDFFSQTENETVFVTCPNTGEKVSVECEICKDRDGCPGLE